MLDERKSQDERGQSKNGWRRKENGEERKTKLRKEKTKSEGDGKLGI